MPTMTIAQMISSRQQEIENLKLTGQQMARKQEVAKLLAAETETREERVPVLVGLKHKVAVATKTLELLQEELGKEYNPVTHVAKRALDEARSALQKEIDKRQELKQARRQAAELAFMNRNRQILDTLRLDLHTDYLQKQENLKLRQKALTETCSLVVEGDMPSIEEVEMVDVNDVKAEVIRLAQQVFLAETIAFKDMWETFRTLEGDDKAEYKKMLLEEVQKFEKEMQVNVDTALAEAVNLIDQLGLDVETPTKKRLVSLFWTILKREHRHAFMVRRNVQKREKTEKFDRKVDTITRFSVADTMFKALGH